MVTNGPEEVGRLPDEAFASHARHPNPSVDEHVAFPDVPAAQPAAPSSLPPTAWAPSSRPRPPQREQLPPELAQIPPEVTAILGSIAARQRPRSRGRLSPAGLGLAAVAALALIMGSNNSVQPDDAGGGFEQGWSQDGVWSQGTDGGLALEALPSVVDATIQPVDQPRYEIPLGPSTVRIEVVSDDPAADVVVTSDSGDAPLGEVMLPFGAELRLQERPDQLAVTAKSRYGQAEIQCRVYADDLLVSIASGYGLVECAAQPTR
jgi:hypothetical protein